MITGDNDGWYDMLRFQVHAVSRLQPICSCRLNIIWIGNTAQITVIVFSHQRSPVLLQCFIAIWKLWHTRALSSKYNYSVGFRRPISTHVWLLSSAAAAASRSVTRSECHEGLCEVTSLFNLSTLCLKNIPDIFDCNFGINYQSLMIFGKNIPDTTYHQMTV